MSSSKNGVLGRNFSVEPARTPGTLGFNDAADPNVKMCMAGDTPGSLGAGKDLATTNTQFIRAKQKPLVLCFDLKTVAHFLRSVAIAKSQQYFTRIDWEEYNKDTVINVIYALMPWKGKPGIALVSQGEPVDVFARADADADALLEVFLNKCSDGPVAAQRYLEQQERIRTHALASVQSVFQDAIAINQDVVQETANGLKWLAGIKCGADLFVTGAGLVTGTGIAGAAIGIAYPIVKEWAKAGTADAVAVKTVEEVGKKAAEEGAAAGGTKIYDTLVPKSVQDVSKWDAEAAILRKKELIAKYQKDLIGKGPSKSAKLTTRINLRTAEIEKLNKAVSPTRQGVGKTAAVAGKSVKFLFAMKDAVESITELIDTFEAANK